MSEVKRGPGRPRKYDTESRRREINSQRIYLGDLSSRWIELKSALNLTDRQLAKHLLDIHDLSCHCNNKYDMPEADGSKVQEADESYVPVTDSSKSHAPDGSQVPVVDTFHHGYWSSVTSKSISKSGSPTGSETSSSSISTSSMSGVPMLDEDALNRRSKSNQSLKDLGFEIKIEPLDSDSDSNPPVSSEEGEDLPVKIKEESPCPVNSDVMWSVKPQAHVQSFVHTPDELSNESASKTPMLLASTAVPQPKRTKDNMFHCSLCSQVYSQRSSLHTHMRIHTGVRPYQCKDCGRSFTDCSTYTKHCRLHTGEKPYACSVCGRCFTQSGNMMRHQAKCEPDTKQKKRKAKFPQKDNIQKRAKKDSPKTSIPLASIDCIAVQQNMKIEPGTEQP